MKIRLKQLSFIATIFLFIGNLAQGQTNNKPKENAKQKDTTLLTYYYVGDGCPSCNIENPEKKFGFKIICVGCLLVSDYNESNKKTIQILDTKFGKGWTVNYINHYCE